jgi:hypothetical protein
LSRNRAGHPTSPQASLRPALRLRLRAARVISEPTLSAPNSSEQASALLGEITARLSQFNETASARTGLRRNERARTAIAETRRKKCHPGAIYAGLAAPKKASPNPFAATPQTVPPGRVRARSLRRRKAGSDQHAVRPLLLHQLACRLEPFSRGICRARRRGRNPVAARYNFEGGRGTNARKWALLSSARFLAIGPDCASWRRHPQAERENYPSFSARNDMLAHLCLAVAVDVVDGVLAEAHRPEQHDLH